jgi:hypothetical protein
MMRIAGLVAMLVIAVLLSACISTPTPTAAPSPTATTLAATVTPTSVLSATPTATRTPVPPSVTPSPSPSLTPTVTRTWTIPTLTPTPSATVVVTTFPPAGDYIHYDWPCQYDPWPGVVTLANGVKMTGLCPNGLYSDGTFKNNNAFKTRGGIDWDMMRTAYPELDYVRMGGMFPVTWAELNPSDGVYNWSIIDNYVAAAKLLNMDTPAGPAPKGVVVKLFNHISNRPAMQGPVPISGQWIFDDLTPQFVKDRMKAALPVNSGILLASGAAATQDNGSYWVKMPCFFTSYSVQDVDVSGPYPALDGTPPTELTAMAVNAGYSVWVVPKYDNLAWKAAAAKFLHDVSEHYTNSDVTFLVGLDGVDGEYGNYLQNSFAGCSGLREALGAQYGVSTNTMVWPEMASVWRSGSQTSHAYVSCTSDCNAQWFVGQNMGLFQARAVEDGPNYHRSGDIGALDWAVRFSKLGLPVSWEAAYTTGTTPYMYQMLSVIAPSWPQWFSFVGGAWGNSDMARYALSFLGNQVTTTNAVWWKSYWTCFGYPDLIDCQDTTLDTGNWSQYSGWPYNIEAGLSTPANMPLVDPWATLTAVQQQDRRAQMLRFLVGTATWTPDKAWKAGSGERFVISVEYLDSGVGSAVLSWDSGSTSLERTNTGNYITHRAYVTGKVGGVTLTVTGAPLLLHGVRIEATP